MARPYKRPQLRRGPLSANRKVMLRGRKQRRRRGLLQTALQTTERYVIPFRCHRGCVSCKRSIHGSTMSFRSTLALSPQLQSRRTVPLRLLLRAATPVVLFLAVMADRQADQMGLLLVPLLVGIEHRVLRRSARWPT